MFKADGRPGGGHRTVEASERMMRKGIVLISEKMPQGYLFVVVTVLLGRVFATAAVLFAAIVSFWFTFLLDADLDVVGPS